jgi:hypothetical protein
MAFDFIFVFLQKIKDVEIITHLCSTLFRAFFRALHTICIVVVGVQLLGKVLARGAAPVIIVAPVASKPVWVAGCLNLGTHVGTTFWRVIIHVFWVRSLVQIEANGVWKASFQLLTTEGIS